MAASRIQGITIEIGGDTTKLTSALKDVNSNIRDTQSQLKDVNSLLKLDPGNTELLAQKQRILSDAIGDTEEKLATLKDAAEQAKKQLDLGEISQSQYDGLQREIQDTENKLKSLENQAEQSKTALQKIATAGDKLQDLGGEISNVGDKLMGVSAGATALGGAAVAAFKTVDQGADVIAQKTGASGEALDAMTDSMKNLASTIPTDFETAGAAIGEVNTKFGLVGSDLENLSGKFIKFANLNNTDVSGSIDNVQSVLAAFGMDTSHAGEMLDVFNATGQATGVDMNTLAQRLSQNAATFQEMGLSAQQSASFMGAVAMSGMDDATAMMGLKTAMKNATKDGVTLNQALADFSSTMSGNKSDTEKLQAAYDLFGTKAGGAFKNAADTGAISFDNLAKSAQDFSGNVEGTFDTTIDGADQMSMSMNKIKGSVAEAGGQLLQTLAPAIEKIADAIGRVCDWFDSLDEGQQQAIVNAGLAVAAAGPAVKAVGGVTEAVGGVMKVAPQIGSTLATVGGKIGGAFSSIGGTLSGVGGSIAGIAGPIGIAAAAVTGIFAVMDNVSPTFHEFWEGGIVNGLKEAVEAVPDFFHYLGEDISEAWDGFKETISTGWENIKTDAGEKWETIKSACSETWEGMKTTISEKWDGFKTTVSTGWENIKTETSTKWENIKSTCGTTWDTMKTNLSTKWDGMKSKVSTTWENVKSNTSTAWANVKQTIATKATEAKNSASTAFESMKTKIGTTCGNIKQTVVNGFNSAIEWIKGLPAQALQWGKDFIGGLVDGIKSMISKVTDAVKGVAEKVKSFLHFSTPDVGPLKDYHKWMPDFVGGLADDIAKSKGLITAQMQKLSAQMCISPTMQLQPAYAGAGGGSYTQASLDSLASTLTAAISKIQPQGQGDIVIPISIGGNLIDEYIINAEQRRALKSGGR